MCVVFARAVVRGLFFGFAVGSASEIQLCGGGGCRCGCRGGGCRRGVRRLRCGVLRGGGDADACAFWAAQAEAQAGHGVPVGGDVDLYVHVRLLSVFRVLFYRFLSVLSRIFFGVFTLFVRLFSDSCLTCSEKSR